jgi:DNA-binding response OmpR family regulator
MSESRKTKDIRVLHVEDDERWCVMVEELLRAEGVHVVTAKSSGDAAGLFREDLFALLVLDLSLESDNASNEEGMILLDQLNQGDRLGSTGVIILSAYTSGVMMRKAFRDYGVTDCMDKFDFDAVTFIKVVKDVLAKHVRVKLEVE